MFQKKKKSVSCKYNGVRYILSNFDLVLRLKFEYKKRQQFLCTPELLFSGLFQFLFLFLFLGLFQTRSHVLTELKDLSYDTRNTNSQYLRDTNYTIITERSFCRACVNYAISIPRERFFVRPRTTSQPFRIRYSPKNHADLVIQEPSSRNKPNRINQAQSLPGPPVHINTDSLSLSLSLFLSLNPVVC